MFLRIETIGSVFFVTLMFVLHASADDSPQAAEITPHAKAHAHNDYYHKRPLLDALDQGFCSVEADIYLVDGKLLVAHSHSELTPEKTLQRLYLDPLRERAQKNNNKIHLNGQSFWLLVDIKSDGENTYAALREILSQYKSMLTKIQGDKITPGAVSIVVSGNRPREMMAAETVRYAFIDGRLTDLPMNPPSHLVPWISDRWTSQFAYRGKGKISDEERAKLKKLVQETKKQGKRIRFWATADTPEMWQELLSADVDLINTDDLTGLNKFLRDAKAKTD